jgi:phage terminase small subunit
VLYGEQSNAWRATFPKSKAKAEVIHVKASAFHSLAKIQVRIKELEVKVSSRAKERFNMDSDWLLEELRGVRDMDVMDIMEDDLKSFKPLSEWPAIWRREISGIDLMTISNSDENIESIIKKIKWPDKTKNRELIGKHVKVSAFSENLNIITGAEVTPWGDITAGVDK